MKTKISRQISHKLAARLKIILLLCSADHIDNIDNLIWYDAILRYWTRSRAIETSMDFYRDKLAHLFFCTKWIEKVVFCTYSTLKVFWFHCSTRLRSTIFSFTFHLHVGIKSGNAKSNKVVKAQFVLVFLLCSRAKRSSVRKLQLRRNAAYSHRLPTSGVDFILYLRRYG